MEEFFFGDGAALPPGYRAGSTSTSLTARRLAVDTGVDSHWQLAAPRRTRRSDARPASSDIPRGLSTLFFTEMWERFSYYGIRPLLVLFMSVGAARRRLRVLDATTASSIVGIYTACVYLASLPGGWIADRLLGLRSAIWYGAHPHRAAGHFSIALSAIFEQRVFFLGLILIVARHRPAQAEHLGHRRRAVSGGRRAARRRFLDLLHGHQPRRVRSRRWSPATWASASAGTGASARPASACSFGVIMRFASARPRTLGTIGLQPARRDAAEQARSRAP